MVDITRSLMYNNPKKCFDYINKIKYQLVFETI